MKRTPEQIAADVESGLRLHGILEFAKGELAEIKARLEADTLAHADEHKPLAEEDREGMQWIAPGGLTMIVTADSLMTSIEERSMAHLVTIEAASNTANDDMGAKDQHAKDGNALQIFAALCKPWHGFIRVESDGLAFRKQCEELLRPVDAEAVIEAWKARDKNGIPKNGIKAEFAQLATDRAQAAAEKRQAKALKDLMKLAKKETTK